MKKRFIPWMVLLAALTACQKENDFQNVAESGAINVTVRASAQEAPVVKTYLDTYEDQDNVVLWGPGEQMQLAVTAGGTTVFAASELTDDFNGAPEAEFSFSIQPVSASSYRYQGIYPASAVEDGDNADPARYRVNLPAVQHAGAGRYDPSAYILVARPTDFDSPATAWTAAFRRATALNKMTLKGLPAGKSVTRVEIVAPAGTYLSGSREMNLSTGESGELCAGSRSVDVVYDSALPGGADLDVWFTSWEAEIGVGETLTVMAYTADKLAYIKPVVIPSGHVIRLQEGCLNTFKVSMAGIAGEPYYFSGGRGTADSPWRVESAADLAEMAAKVNAGTGRFASDCYRQTADIDLAYEPLEAIGHTNASGAQRFFKGSYDGNGFKVKNLRVVNSLNTATSAGSNKAFGFFGYLAEGAHINRLYLERPKVQAQTTYNIGSLAGCIEGSSTVIVENCTVVDGTVSEGGSSGWHVGGLVGRQMSGTIRNCSFSGTVRNTQNNKAGGIVGNMSGGSIIGCRVTGSSTLVEVANDYAGGIVGLADGTTGTKLIEGCVVNCQRITATKGYVGGIVGQWNTGEGIINRCTVLADITNNSASGSFGNLGGIVGYASSSGYKLVIANCCYAGGELCNYNGTGGSVGGILGGGNSSGLNQKFIVNCCAFPSKILSGSSTRNLGGIAGWVKNWTIRNCYCPAPHTAFWFNGAPIASDEASSGSIYGWYSSTGVVQDAYWLSTFQVGKGTASPNTNQSLSDAQMRGTGSVTRPSTGVSYDNFVLALNADAASWNESPELDVYAQSWEVYTNGYPVPKGTSAAAPAGEESPSGMNLLALCGDKITEYQGAAVAANHIYLCAHRGHTRWSKTNNYPENCVPTIQKAIELGVDMVEIDVRQTSDGYPVVLHDESIKPVTNCTLSGAANIYVQNLTLATVQSYRMRNRGGSNYPTVHGEYIHIPTLEEVLAVCKDKVYVTIHIKDEALKSDPTPVLAAIDHTGTVNQVCIFGASDKKAYVAQAFEMMGSPLAIQPWLDVASDVTTYQPSYFGCCKLFQYDFNTYYDRTIEGFGKAVHAYGALSFSNAIDEDSGSDNFDAQLKNWYANQASSCQVLDRFIESGSDFLQVNYFEIADAYFKAKGLR